MLLYIHTLLWRMMVWVTHRTVLIFGDNLRYIDSTSLLFVPPFWVSYFPFRPSLSQCTSGDLKPVPLGEDPLANFHFDFAVGPVDPRALFQCRVFYPLKLFFFYLMLSQDCSHKEGNKEISSPSILHLHIYFLKCWYFYDKEYKLCLMWYPLRFVIRLCLKS